MGRALTGRIQAPGPLSSTSRPATQRPDIFLELARQRMRLTTVIYASSPNSSPLPAAAVAVCGASRASRAISGQLCTRAL